MEKKVYILMMALCLFNNLLLKAQIQKDTTLALNNNFKVKFSKGESFGNFKTFNSITVLHKGVKVYSGNKYEYELGDKLYPFIIKTGENSFELLLEVNDRPNKNFLQHVKIKNNKTFQINKLPTFIAKAADLENNHTLEFAGFWGYSEVWGDHNSLTDYNPILFYKITSTGIMLDTVLTIQRNTSIYGVFKGFEDDTNKPVSVKRAKQFQSEIARIEAVAKKDKK